MSHLFHSKEKISTVVVGDSRFLGRGYWKIKYITLIDPVMNPSQISERNHVTLLKWFLWGFVVGYELQFL